MASDSKSVIVTVTDAALADIQQVAGRLKKCGLTVTRVLPVTGVIAGSISGTKLSELRSVTGVDSVELERTAYPTEP